MKLLLIAVALFTAHESQANYYRVFQGTRLADFSQDRYISELPAFLRKTIQLYEVDNSILNSYLVAVPPKDKPEFVPDEFALVDLVSQPAYQEVRNTDAGRAYSEAHWTLFERSKSASTPYLSAPNLPSQIDTTTALDVIGQPVVWRAGYTTFFLGVKRASLSNEEYFAGMLTHVKAVANAFVPKGLLGYIVLITPEYEVAFMNWSSKAAADAAFGSYDGEQIRQQSNALLYFLQFSEAQTVPAFRANQNGNLSPVLERTDFGSFYSVLKK